MYYHSDHLGSSNILTDSDGNAIRRTEYTPYGEIFNNWEADPDSEMPNFFFTGKRLDEETGLYYYGARYYDPKLGRFTQADSIVPSPANPQSLNRYSYTDNNPINYIDPSGHFSLKKWIGKIVGVISAVATYIAAGGPANPAALPLAMSAYGFTSGVIDAYNAGYSLGEAYGMGVLQGTAAYIGGEIGGAFGTWAAGGAAAPAAGLSSAIFGGMAAGAAGGATHAALIGGDVGEAAWQGGAIGGATALFSYGLTYRGPPSKSLTEEAIDEAVDRDVNIQQASDIGAEEGPEGRLAAADKLSSSALRPAPLSERVKSSSLKGMYYEATYEGEVDITLFNKMTLKNVKVSGTMTSLPPGTKLSISFRFTKVVPVNVNYHNLQVQGSLTVTGRAGLAVHIDSSTSGNKGYILRGGRR